MEGYLDLWVNMLYRFQPHYFILFENTLLYCHAQGGKQLGSIHLQISEIQTNEDYPLEIWVDSGVSKIKLRAKSEGERNRWLDALRRGGK
jgi:hypothetical protein